MHRSKEGKRRGGNLLKNDLDDSDGYAREILRDKNFGSLMLWPCWNKDFLFCSHHITASASSSTISDKPCLLLHVSKEQRIILLQFVFAYYPPETRVMLLFNCSVYMLCTLCIEVAVHIPEPFTSSQWETTVTATRKSKISNYKSFKLLFTCILPYMHLAYSWNNCLYQKTNQPAKAMCWDCWKVSIMKTRKQVQQWTAWVQMKFVCFFAIFFLPAVMKSAQSWRRAEMKWSETVLPFLQ